MTSKLDMLVQEQSYEQEYDEEQDQVGDTLDLPGVGRYGEMRVEGDAKVRQQVMAPISKPRSRPGHVRITSTLSTKGRTQRGAGISSSDGQGPTSLTQTLGQSQYNTHEFQSSIKEGARAAAGRQ